jgi:hypothetical protein
MLIFNYYIGRYEIVNNSVLNLIVFVYVALKEQEFQCLLRASVKVSKNVSLRHAGEKGERKY